MVNPPPVSADNWSQDTFPSTTGVFTDTAPANSDADVVLSSVDGPWEGRANALANVFKGGALCSTGDDFIYAFYGQTNAFTRYSILLNSWSVMTDTLLWIDYGSALCYPGSGDFIYALRGNGGSFWRYSISGDEWFTRTGPSTSVSYGGDLVYPGSGDFIYCVLGQNIQNPDGTKFKRYSISGNSWSNRADTPAAVYRGGSLVYPGSGDFIYALRGNYTTDFWRYSISGDAWSARANTPFPSVGYGGSLVYPGSGDFIYAFIGQNTPWFKRYSISGDSWSTRANAPANVSYGGSLVYPGSGNFIYAFPGKNTSPGSPVFWRYKFGYTSPGTYVSEPITPTGVSEWGILNYTVTSPTDTILTIDVLSSSNNFLLQANVPSGTDLQATYPDTFTNITGIKLRAVFSTTNTAFTPTLSDWSVDYQTSTFVTTTNWTSIVKVNKAVVMGNSIPYVKFDMKTTKDTAKWKRFRIDKSTGGSPTPIPDNKIEVQVWCENNNNGFFDTGDKLISKGNFTDGKCYLNMKRYLVTTTSKTYYIVYKLAGDIGGGQRAGVTVKDSSYLEFENATCIGVP